MNSGVRTSNNPSFVMKLMKNQCFIPLIALLMLVVFNLIADPGFFAITLGSDTAGNSVLSGFLITILDSGSELAILAIGMTLVTAALEVRISVSAPQWPSLEVSSAGSLWKRRRRDADTTDCCLSCECTGGDAMWCVQWRTGGIFQDTANDRHPDPLYGRAFHCGVGEQQ